MADLTWYSREGADQRFLTKTEGAGLATKSEVTQGDTALSVRIDAVKVTAEAALPSATAASTYATKDEVEALKQQTPAAPDLSDYATKAEMLSADAALGQRIDGVKATADAALPKTEAASTYATRAALSGYDTSADIRAAYATKEELSAVRGALPAPPDLSPYLTKASAATTYASKADLAKAQAGGKVDLSGYLTKSEAESQYSTQDALTRGLAGKVSTSDLAPLSSRIDSLGKTISPFQPGERYYSPVTYFWPDYYEDGKPGKTSKWAQILKFAGSLGIVILNRNSGNWDEFNVDFKKQAELALAAGAKRAVFYVKTQYLAATLPAGDPGRNNVPNVDKYTPDYVLGQIEKARTQYGDVCQGVFLDEAINGWGAQAGRIPAYKSLIDKIRAKYGKDFLIVINSGSNISEDMCKLDFDVCMMFEKEATAFLNEDPGTPILPDHMKAYPSTRWWAVVHGVTSENYRKVFDKADGLGIAHLYITDGQLREDPQQGGQWEPVGNPYANPPSNHILELVVPWLKGYLPLKLEVDDLRTRPRVLSLGKHEAVPAGTPAGTIIVRKEA